MKTHLKPHRPLTAAFTLIELLIVIVIIAILAGVSFPIAGMVRTQALKAEAKNELRNLANAIAMYQMEYSKLPFAGGGSGDRELDTESDTIMAVLSGYDIDGLNPRQKVFYEGKRAKGLDTSEPTGGLVGEGESVTLVDPWGNPYYIMMDGDYDKTLIGLPGMDEGELRKSVATWTETFDDEGVPLDESQWIKNW